MKKTELLIIGAGAAGISAAVSAWDAGCRDILLADRASVPGGVLPQCIHEGFGAGIFGRELTGPEFARRLIKRLDATGVSLRLNTTVTALSADKTAILSGRDGVERMGFERLILATGCREISIGSLMISGTRPEGIYTAGQAQEMINLRGEKIGRNALILGSGDLGMIMARRIVLSGGRTVAVIEKGDRWGGMARNYHRCIETLGIPILFNTEITRIYGYPHIEGVAVRSNADGEERRIECDTLITAIGMIPERSLLKGAGAGEHIMLCGNCGRIHSMIDSAVEEGERVGKEILSIPYAELSSHEG